VSKNSEYQAEFNRLVEASKNRPPIVYLRSFRSERMGLSIFKYMFTDPPPGVFGYWDDIGDAVLHILRVVAPAVALSPPAGPKGVRYWSPSRAERISVLNEEWQTVISERLRQATLVLVQLDDTASLQWELKELVRVVPPIKVLLLLPPTKKEYNGMRSHVQHIFPHPLPAELPKTRLMTFRPGWESLPLRQIGSGPGVVWMMLEPVFDQNGFEQPPWRRMYGYAPRAKR
jgi:hypothetical protein